MRTHQMTLAIAALLLTATVSAQGLGGTPPHRSGGGRVGSPPPPPGPLHGLSDLDLEYDRWSSNGVLEYAFTAPEWMSPGQIGYERPAEIIAGLFLQRNASLLGIRQSLSAFKLDTIDVDCAGAAVVRFRQTYVSYAVESTFFELVVSGQSVSHVRARFIPDVDGLPLCQPVAVGGMGTVSIRYVPDPRTTNIVIVTTQEEVTQRFETILEACTGQLIGFRRDMK